VQQFRQLENGFSDKELSVVAGFLGESVEGVVFLEEAKEKKVEVKVKPKKGETAADTQAVSSTTTEWT